jgi:uncharacterized protein
MKFTWDEEKNAINRRKHGVDFCDVSPIFDKPMVTFLDQRKEYGEDRWVGIGWLRDILAVIVFTEPDDETIRIISARKAKRHETHIYKQEIRN